MIDKIANPAQAANLYASTQKSGDAGSGGGINFGDLIKSGLQNAIGTVRGADAATASAVAGKADLADVVQSISKAELTLQSVVAIRDRMVNAYQEILRMPI